MGWSGPHKTACESQGPRGTRHGIITAAHRADLFVGPYLLAWWLGGGKAGAAVVNMDLVAGVVCGAFLGGAALAIFFTVFFVGDRATEDLGMRLMVVIALGAWLGSLAGLMTALHLRPRTRAAGLFGVVLGGLSSVMFGVPTLASPPADGVPVLVSLLHPGYLGAPFLWSVLLAATGMWLLCQSSRARKGSSA